MGNDFFSQSYVADCRFWLEFRRPLFRVFSKKNSPWSWCGIDYDLSRLVWTDCWSWFKFRKSIFQLCVFHVVSVVATISLSFNWLSILIRVSNILCSFFFCFFFVEARGSDYLALILADCRFWYESRKSVCRCFSILLCCFLYWGLCGSDYLAWFWAFFDSDSGFDNPFSFFIF